MNKDIYEVVVEVVVRVEATSVDSAQNIVKNELANLQPQIKSTTHIGDAIIDTEIVEEYLENSKGE